MDFAKADVITIEAIALVVFYGVFCERVRQRRRGCVCPRLRREGDMARLREVGRVIV
jgi:hypothetical protein